MVQHTTQNQGTSRWIEWLPLIVLAASLIILFNRLFLGEVNFWGLPSLQFYPWREYAMSEISQGRLPLWNPYNGAGAPLLANYQSGLLYPPHLLYFISTSPQMMGFIGLLHVMWAGYGMWLLIRRYTNNLLAGGIAVLAYPLSNTLIARFGTIPMLEVAAWLPFLILAVDALIESSSLRWTLALAVITAMMLLAGHAQWTFYCMVVAGSYALWKLISTKGSLQRNVVIGILAIGALLLAVGLASAQLLPTAELQRQSQRASGIDPDFAMNFSYPPISLLTLLNPNFFGNPGDGSYSINGVYYENAAYVGILPLIFALIGLWIVLRRKRTAVSAEESLHIQHRSAMRFFAITAVISLILALGKFGITPFLFRYVPTFNLFQAPSRWLLLTVFSLTMLAALAVPLWKPDRRMKRRANLALIGSIMLVIAGVIGQVMMSNVSGVTLQLVRGVTVLGILLAGVALCFIMAPLNEKNRFRWQLGVLVFVAADLVWANALNNPTVPASFYNRNTTELNTKSRLLFPDPTSSQLPQRAFDEYLNTADYRIASVKLSDYRRSMLPNLNMIDRQLSWNNFDPLRPEGFEHYSRLLNTAITNLDKAGNSSALLRAAGIGQVIGTVSLSDSAPSRVWMVAKAVNTASLEEAEALLKQKDWNPDDTVILTGATDNSASSATNAGTATITSETPNGLTIQVNSPEGGWLVVADSYYPGWVAAINGTNTPIYRANLAFRSVQVPAGESTFTVQYQPNSWRLGVSISLVSAITLLVLSGLAIARGTKKPVTFKAQQAQDSVE
jgi:hypothetical protein